MDFLLGNDFEKHGAVKDLWTYMLKNQNGSVSQYFGLEDLNRTSGRIWDVDRSGEAPSDWEAQITATDIQQGSDSKWVPVQGGLKPI